MVFIFSLFFILIPRNSNIQRWGDNNYIPRKNGVRTLSLGSLPLWELLERIPFLVYSFGLVWARSSASSLFFGSCLFIGVVPSCFCHVTSPFSHLYWLALISGGGRWSNLPYASRDKLTSSLFFDGRGRAYHSVEWHAFLLTEHLLIGGCKNIFNSRVVIARWKDNTF